MALASVSAVAAMAILNSRDGTYSSIIKKSEVSKTAPARVNTRMEDTFSRFDKTIDANYQSVCGNITSDKDLDLCNLYIASSTLTVSGMIEKLVAEEMVDSSRKDMDGKEISIQDQIKLKHQWRQYACFAVLRAETLPELDRHTDYCLSTGLKITKIFNVDQTKFLDDVVQKIRHNAHDAAQKAPGKGMIRVSTPASSPSTLFY